MKMEVANEECPTDILIDLKEDILPSYSIAKENSIVESVKPKVYLQEKEDALLNMKVDHLSILDTSPVRIIDDCDFRLNMTVNAVVTQGSKLKEVIDDCPTAVLVDVPGSSSFALKPTIEFNSSEYNWQHDKYTNVAEELKDEIYADSSLDDFRKDFINGSPEVDKMNDQLPLPRKRWKTPSPQSMSRISKEASKIVDNLNSSAIFDEDSLLTEEKLPIPINFDNFDLEDDIEQNEKANIENNGKNELLKLNVQTQNSMSSKKKEKENISYGSLSMFKENIKSIQSDSKIIYSNASSEDNVIPDWNSNSLSSAITSDSNDSIKFSMTNVSIDDVFIEKPISSEDKENMQREICKNAKLNHKTPSKQALKSKSDVQLRATLRNLSNIKSESTYSQKYSPNSKVLIPQKRMSFAAKTKETQSSVGKLQIKKSIKVGPENVSKVLNRSNSFLLPSTKELGKQKPNFTMKTTLSSDSMSSSSDIKQENTFSKMKTPSKRYSISTSTPLKRTSIVKPALTPALHNNPSSKYTPQPAQVSRLSFSQSWQPPPSVSHIASSKEVKGKISTPPVCPSSFKAGLGIQNKFNNQRRLSFSQSMSTASFRSLGKNAMSTTSKSRFHSKLNLPSPLPATEDKKLARTLFPSLAGK